MAKLVGIISDTHGLMRPAVLDVFKGVDLILHAGDIGSPDVLTALETLAPVIAVRGNNDKGDWAVRLQECQSTQVSGVSIYMLHDLKQLDVSQVRGRFQVIVSGHSHKPRIDRREDGLYVNPGSAGPRRFNLPISVARLTIRNRKVSAELIPLL